MNLIKIEYEVKDHKMGGNYFFSEIATTVEAAIKYLDKEYPGMEDVTDKRYVDCDNPPVKVFFHEKQRYDEDGAWDYPRQTTIELYFVEVIE